MTETRKPFCLLCNLIRKEPGRSRAGARHNLGCPKRPTETRKAVVAECREPIVAHCLSCDTGQYLNHGRSTWLAGGGKYLRDLDATQERLHKGAGHDVRSVEVKP